jgi:hypothetical protein
MDSKELAVKLETFKQTCQDKGYIIGDLYFDEAYPGIKSTSYIVKMMVKKSWMDTLSSSGKALRQLLEVLFETTDAKTRESVFTISIYGEHEAELLIQSTHREAA